MMQILFFIVLVGFFGVTAQYYVGPCLEQCCCKVCSAPQNEAYPYGVTVTPIQSNPANPQVAGSTCNFPVWSDGALNDTSGNPVSPPSTLWWTSFEVFADNEKHSAPSTCSCCQFSGVDTSCAEQRPMASKPSIFRVLGADIVEHMSATLVFEEGVELSKSDIIELRNDTFCGYATPKHILRSNASQLSLDASATKATWNVAHLPKGGCYRVCYYHSTQTTPTWYFVGNLRVFHAPAPSATFVLDHRDVPLTGNSVSITFVGQNLLSVFDDVVELRTSGGCGSGGETASSASYGRMDTLRGAEWCLPAVIPGITAFRPLQFIDPVYSDCPAANRLSQDRLIWSLVLPAPDTYTVCFRTQGAWSTLGTFVVESQASALASLQSLYTATNGNQWIRRSGWHGSDPCNFHGIRCNAAGDVEAIYLARNGLDGTIPSSLFLSQYFNTLESISLEENELTGTVPHSVGVLRNLRYLHLGFNRLSGTLPSSLQRASLIQFYFSNNNFEGFIPDSIDDLSFLWAANNNPGVSSTATPSISPLCPTDDLICSDKGSTDVGVTPCGHDSISKEECITRHCCFNAQAPLVFGGTACFTKKSAHYSTHPPCQGQPSCVKLSPSDDV